MIEESLKNIKKLRIFDGRQSLSDYSYTLARASLQCDRELSFGPFDTLILTIPKKLVEAEVLRVANEAAKKKAEKEENDRRTADAIAKKVAAEKKKWKEKEASLKAAIKEAKKRYEELKQIPEPNASEIEEANNAVKKAEKEYQSEFNKLIKARRSSASNANSSRHEPVDDDPVIWEPIRMVRVRNLRNPLAEEAAADGVINNGLQLNRLFAPVRQYQPLQELVDQRRAELEPPPADLLQQLPVNVLRRINLRPYRQRIVEPAPSTQLKHKYTDLSGFLAPLFPSVNSLVVWTNFIACTPCQLDVAKLISAWNSTLQVLSVRTYVSGRLEDYDGIEMNEYVILRNMQLDAISKLPILRRFHMGESESAPNNYLPLKERRLSERIVQNIFSCPLELPPSVERLSLNFRVFDSKSMKIIRDLQEKELNHLTELDVTYIRSNVSKKYFFLVLK